MNVKVFALAAGTLWGLLVFAFTLIETARGEGYALTKLNVLYFGYSVSYLGSIIGWVYGFVSVGWRSILLAVQPASSASSHSL